MCPHLMCQSLNPMVIKQQSIARTPRPIPNKNNSSLICISLLTIVYNEETHRGPLTLVPLYYPYRGKQCQGQDEWT